MEKDYTDPVFFKIVFIGFQWGLGRREYISEVKLPKLKCFSPECGNSIETSSVFICLCSALLQDERILVVMIIKLETRSFTKLVFLH